MTEEPHGPGSFVSRSGTGRSPLLDSIFANPAEVWNDRDAFHNRHLLGYPAPNPHENTAGRAIAGDP